MLLISLLSKLLICLYNVKVERADKARKAGDEARDGVPGVWKQELNMFPEKVQRYAGISSESDNRLVARNMET